MAILLGIDTGGTFTDAVLFDEDAGRVVASAKALTTRHDLAVGIGEAMAAVMDSSAVTAADVQLVSLSTTLATNALVEGRQGRVCLVSIGHSNLDLARAGLMEAVGSDPLIAVDGGHTATGAEAKPLDLDALDTELDTLGDSVQGFAVAAMFATRNAAHEIAVRDRIRERTGLPVTCSHELSSKLDSPRRALTSVLNARLIGLIVDLILAAERHMAHTGIEAPLMVVRGDGALISAEVAKTRPIETILSGPAASVVGAAFLTGSKTALVSDIGGTTTDVAVVTEGRPALDAEGATVGGWRTMVEAIAIQAIGLGGDSEVGLEDRGMSTGIKLGPRRCVPLALAALTHPDLVHATLDRHLTRDIVGETDGRIALPLPVDPAEGTLSKHELAVWRDLDGRPAAVDALANTRLRATALTRLTAKGLVQIAGVTPTDALHVLGLHTVWDAQAADKGLALFARRRDWRGDAIAANGAALAGRILAGVVEASSDIVLQTAFAADGFKDHRDLPAHPLTRAAVDGRDGLLSYRLTLNAPIVALGASAGTYYPRVGERLGCKVIVPDLAGVANAVGAVVGQVRIQSDVTVTEPEGGRFRIHTPDGAQDFPDLDAALAQAEALARADAEARAVEAGAGALRVRCARDVRQVDTNGQTVFIEARVSAVASGRPRLAAETP
jgi:N-methylhydantoinase A/oxoprolinase/acetone carboxylase beta subunit